MMFLRRPEEFLSTAKHFRRRIVCSLNQRGDPWSHPALLLPAALQILSMREDCAAGKIPSRTAGSTTAVLYLGTKIEQPVAGQKPGP